MKKKIKISNNKFVHTEGMIVRVVRGKSFGSGKYFVSQNSGAADIGIFFHFPLKII